MKKITLDFSDCKYISEIYKEIKNKFDFPSYYGENLDALWDSLDGYCKNDIEISINGYDKLSDDLKEYMDKMFAIFERVTKYNPNMIFVKGE